MMFCHSQLDVQVCLSKFFSQNIFLHCLYTVSFHDFLQYLATRTTATWINLVIILKYWQFINTHTHIVCGPLSAFQDLGFFWKQFPCFWELSLSERKLEARLCVTIELVFWTLLATAWHPSLLLLQQQMSLVSWRLKCISLLFPAQVRKSYWTVPFSVKFKACPHVGGRDQLTLVSLQCTGKVSAGEMHLGAAEVWSMAVYHWNQAKLHLKLHFSI